MREPVYNRSHSGEDLYAITYMQHQREPGLRHVRSEPHISPTDVETVLSGLVPQDGRLYPPQAKVELGSSKARKAENTVIVLPRTCCEAAGLAPNINDKQQPKHLWVGRLKHLNRMLSATSLQQAVQPQEVRRSFLQAALDEVECRRPSDAEIPMQLAQLPGWKLQQMAHAAIVIQKMWRGRRARQANSLDVLKAFAACITKGTVVFLCGSTGLAGDSLRYVRMLAGLGYLVIAPDALAGTSPLRHRRPRLILRPDQATDYWERNLLYEDDGAEGELVYVSTSEGVLASPDHFDQVFNNIITVRQAELAFTLRRLPAFIKRQGVFLFGMSEGAVTLSTFNDEYFASMVRGRVLASYSCECNYWNYNRPEDVGIAGSADIPTLNLMGFEDEYFGVHNSVAATVAAYGGYPPIAGHAFQPMVERGIQWGLACHFEGGHHSLLLSHDDIIREILSDFLVRPLTTCRSLAVLWGNLPDLQDEITRVRRSADEKVLYVRIRPSPGPVSPPLATKQSSRLEALLDALCARLYEVENSDGAAHPGAPNWSELHLTPPHSPQTSGSASGLAAGLRPGGASPVGGRSPIASSPEGATPTFAAGLDKSKARAATARLLAHFALRNGTQPNNLVPQSSLPAGSSPLGPSGGTSSGAASAPPGPSTATTPSSSSSGLADTPTAASLRAGEVNPTPDAAAGRERQGHVQQQLPGQHHSAAPVARSARLAEEGRGAASPDAQNGPAPAANLAAAGAQRDSSPPPLGTAGSASMHLDIPQQRAVLANSGGERASNSPTQPGGSPVVSALSAALRGSSLGSPGGSPVVPKGLAAASGHGPSVAAGSSAVAASHPATGAAEQPAATDAAGAAWDGPPTASQGLSSSPGRVHTRPHPGLLANGIHGQPLGGAAGAAAELHFSPVQKLLAASLANEQQLSPSSSPPRAGRSLAPWQQARPLNTAGVGPGHYFTRSYSGRSLAAAAAASAAALGVASAEQQQEEFEAGLETLQDWMSSQGAQPSSPGKPRSPQRVSRPPSARSTDSMRRPPRSVHFSEQEEPRPSRSCEAGWGSFAGGSEGIPDDDSGSDFGTEKEDEATRERNLSLPADLQRLCRAMAAQADAVTKANEALASTAQAASWVAAGSLAALVLLSFVVATRPR